MTEISVEDLDIFEVASYLQSVGWQRREEWRGGGIWTREGAPEVLIPDQRGFLDEAERLRDLMRVLIKVEDRPELEIVQDIIEPMVDKQSYRTQPPGPSGTIPLLTGIHVLEGIRDLMGTAARSLFEGSRILFTKQRGKEATDFLKGVRLGTTQPGSYIITARVPLTWPQETMFDEPEVPLGRQVIERMYQAIGAVHSAAAQISQGANRNTFASTVSQGVSVQLCEAIAALGGTRNDLPFDMGFSWARGMRTNPPPAHLSFNGEMAGIIAQGAKDLRQLATTGRATITGRIEKLHFDPLPHRVQVRGLLERPHQQTEERTVWVRLDTADYERASGEHHHREVRFRFTGHLIMVDRRTEMLLDRPGFEIIPPRE